MPVVIDTDGGVDDAVALWWALAHLDVAAVTTVAGNVRVGQATALVRRVLRELGRTDLPVAHGLDLPARLENRHDAPMATLYAPDDHPSAPALLAELPDATDLIALGPLTNVAAAIEIDPTLPQRLGRVVVMGGPPERGEFNFTHDKDAADAVLAATWRTEPLVLGIDRTELATLTEEHFALLAERRTPAARFLDDALRAYRNVHGGGDCPVHDLLAVLAYVDPEVDVTGLRAAARQLFG
jgi:inosine-uridine nucleoside N-ribohydrolase